LTENDTCSVCPTVDDAPETHLGGEKVFVDFAADTIDIFGPVTGEAHPMKLFVATMGASNYTYAEACPSESLSDWIGVHTNLFTFVGGVPKFVAEDHSKFVMTGLRMSATRLQSLLLPRPLVPAGIWLKMAEAG
jgi:transposase